MSCEVKSGDSPHLFVLALLFCFLLSVQSVYPEEKKLFKPRFSIKLTAGGGFALIGDVNRQLELVNNNVTFEYWRKHDPNSIAGEIKKLNNWFYDWEAELRIDLSRRFGVGIAVSRPFHRRNESTLSFASMEERGSGPQITEMYYRPDIKFSMPIKLNFYYSRLLGKRLRVFLSGGIGYYPGRLSLYRRWVIDNNQWESMYWEVKSKFPFGYHVGAAIEYPLMKKLSLVMDIQGRFIVIRNLQGWIEGEFSDGTYGKYNGTLYSIERWEDRIAAYIGDFILLEVSPEIWGSQRRAILDLTGVVLRVGIRINLF